MLTTIKEKFCQKIEDQNVWEEMHCSGQIVYVDGILKIW
jgi:hypothetical protein